MAVTKSAKKISVKAKKAEVQTDAFLLKWTRRLIDHPYTLGIVAVGCLGIIAWRWW